MKNWILLSIVVSLFLCGASAVHAAQVGTERIVQGTVTRIVHQDAQSQTVDVVVDGKTYKTQTGSLDMVRKQIYQPGDEVLVSLITQPDGSSLAYIKEYVRTKQLIVLFILFFIGVAVVARKKGIFSVLAMIGGFFVLFLYTLPAIMSGADPVNTSLITACVLIPTTFYVAHGFNKKTHVAVVSSLLVMIIVIVLSLFWIQWANLTGLATDEASQLAVMAKGVFDMRSILLASIIIGSIGILDDITVSQVAIVQELQAVAKTNNKSEIFFRAMKIGGDHITSMVNTLVLVYVGAALPLFLIYVKNPQPFGQLIQYEVIAEEIIRSLIGSIGLVVSVPLSTFIASRVF